MGFATDHETLYETDNALYKSITVFYLIICRKLFARLQAHSTSLLVHCISGWDRTPLFVSMIRLSLWADGVVHKNLNAHEILYLTIGYDWFLFGHQLPSRLYKGEDIFYFCFYMLKHITRNKYSCVGRRRLEINFFVFFLYQQFQFQLQTSKNCASVQEEHF